MTTAPTPREEAERVYLDVLSLTNRLINLAGEITSTADTKRLARLQRRLAAVLRDMLEGATQ